MKKIAKFVFETAYRPFIQKGLPLLYKEQMKTLSISLKVCFVAFVILAYPLFHVLTKENVKIIVCNNTCEKINVTLSIRGHSIANATIPGDSAIKIEPDNILEGGFVATLNGRRHEINSYVCPGLNQTAIIVVNETNDCPVFFSVFD